MQNEIWVSAFGWENYYEVSNIGNIRSLTRTGITFLGERNYLGGAVKPILQKTRGYYVVNLTKKGCRKQISLHRLILESFTKTSPAKLHACHNDGNKKNCCINNLRWDTPKGNCADKKIHGTWQVGEKGSKHSLTNKIVIDIRESNESIMFLAKKYGVSKNTIFRAKNSITYFNI